MFPLVCEILFHLCILGTYFWDRSEIMLSCWSPKQKHTSWITQCAFHLEMEERALTMLLKRFCMVVGAWYAWLHPQLGVHTVSGKDMFQKSTSEVLLPPSDRLRSCLIENNVVSQKNLWRRSLNSDLSDWWFSFSFFIALQEQPHTLLLVNCQWNFFKSLFFMIWLNFRQKEREKKGNLLSHCSALHESTTKLHAIKIDCTHPYC